MGDFGRYCDDLVIEITVPRDYTAPTPGPVYLAGRPQDEVVEFPLAPGSNRRTISFMVVQAGRA